MDVGPKLAEVRINKLAINLVAIPLSVLLLAAGVLLARMIRQDYSFQQLNTVALLICVVVIVPVHEGIHAVGLLNFARVSRRDIRFGMMWRAMMPYCHCTVPIPIQAFRRMALLPLWVTGPTAVALLILFPDDWVGLTTGTTWAGCIGDVWLVVRLRHFKDDSIVQDSPTEIGCVVFSPIQTNLGSLDA